MASKRRIKPDPPWYRGADIPLKVIRDFARRVAEHFHPDKIILFGSYAYGTPHADSDVDILVVMPARNEIDQAVRIDLACEPCFPLDIIVRTPENMRWRLEEGDSFLREITSQGKVLYEKADEGVGAKSGSRFLAAGKLVQGSDLLHDQVCFFCQQCAEKYLKARLEELGLAIPRTHVLENLLIPLLSHHPSLHSLRRGMRFLTRFAVGPRYPGYKASKRQARAALRWAGNVRDAVRPLLEIWAPGKRRGISP